jgi:hypothetical protein
MNTKRMYFAALGVVLMLVLAGCFSAADKLQRTYFGESKTLKYGPVMAFCFKDGVWSEVKDPQNGSLAQFKGVITSGLHDFAMAKITKTGERSTFDAACGYVGNLIKTGKIAGDANITFKPADYPFDPQGKLVTEKTAAFFASPDSPKNIRMLNIFYLNRYWADGSECILQWKFDKKGKPVLVKASNKYWDDDPSFANSDAVVQMINDYTVSMSNAN